MAIKVVDVEASEQMECILFDSPCLVELKLDQHRPIVPNTQRCSTRKSIRPSVAFVHRLLQFYRAYTQWCPWFQPVSRSEIMHQRRHRVLDYLSLSLSVCVCLSLSDSLSLSLPLSVCLSLSLCLR